MMEDGRLMIVEHLLVGNGVEHLLCAKNRRRMESPEMILLHYTAGTSAVSSVRYLSRPDVKASAHLVVGRDGNVFQLVPFNVEAWHAGQSSYAGRVSLNQCSIGIELDNLGRLEYVEGKFRAECGRVVSPEEVYTARVGNEVSYWHRYTGRQLEVLRKVCRLLEVCYPIRYVLGHADVTPRKQDPGPELEGFMRR